MLDACSCSWSRRRCSRRGQSPGYGPISEEKGIHDARTSALQLLAGLVLAAGGVFTAWTVRLNRDSNAHNREVLITDRYARAIELLGSEQPSVRLGGVYALDRITRDSPRDSASIVTVLDAHARAWGRGAAWEHRVLADVEAAVIVVSKRDRTADDGFFPVLNNVGLSHARLRRYDLSEARLRGANLFEALLDGAKLNNAKLKNANLTNAHLDGADLTGASSTTPTSAGRGTTTRPAGADGFDYEAAGAVPRE